MQPDILYFKEILVRNLGTSGKSFPLKNQKMRVDYPWRH